MDLDVGKFEEYPDRGFLKFFSNCEFFKEIGESIYGNIFVICDKNFNDEF